jgi:hypothetical protein
MSHLSDTDNCPPNWARFYCVLNRLGPLALRQIPKSWVPSLQEEGKAADMFWSEDIQYCLFTYWSQSPELAVAEALTRYTESVQTTLCEFPYDGFEAWRSDPVSGEILSKVDCVAGITCHPIRPRILKALVNAASQPESASEREFD